MTDWKENESYLYKKFDELNKILISEFSTVRTYDINADKYEEIS